MSADADRHQFLGSFPGWCCCDHWCTDMQAWHEHLPPEEPWGDCQHGSDSICAHCQGYGHSITSGTSQPVPGHGLVDEGWPYTDRGMKCHAARDRGRAKCSCGRLSPLFGTRAARKRWHRRHKAWVLAWSVPGEVRP